MIISSNILNVSLLNSYKSSNRTVSFGCSNDAFIKEGRKKYSDNDLLKILQGENFEISKKFLESLSPEEYKFCLKYANGSEKIFGGMFQYSDKSVMKEDVDDIVRYSNIFYKGLEQVAKANNKKVEDIVLVSIGQSPTSIVKAMELKGIKTAYCPISGLASFKEPLEKYVNEKTVDKILYIWGKFGFSIDDLKSDKLVIFTDHKETGNTFMIFKDMIDKIKDIKNIKGDKDKTKFLKLKYIFYQGKPTKEDKEFEKDFYDSAFHTSYIKTLYSPLFKLPLTQIHNFDESFKNYEFYHANMRFNKLIILLFDRLINGNDNSEGKPRSHRAINNEREFRLSFYTPEN